MYSISEMHEILLRERARADRNEHKFSLIIFDINEKKNSKVFMSELVDVLKNRLRSIDEFGWFSEHQIGIFLIYTSAENAIKVAGDIRRILKNEAIIKLNGIFSYPSLWPYKNTPEND